MEDPPGIDAWRIFCYARAMNNTYGIKWKNGLYYGTAEGWEATVIIMSALNAAGVGQVSYCPPEGTVYVQWRP